MRNRLVSNAIGRSAQSDIRQLTTLDDAAMAHDDGAKHCIFRIGSRDDRGGSVHGCWPGQSRGTRRGEARLCALRLPGMDSFSLWRTRTVERGTYCWTRNPSLRSDAGRCDHGRRALHVATKSRAVRASRPRVDLLGSRCDYCAAPRLRFARHQASKPGTPVVPAYLSIQASDRVRPFRAALTRAPFASQQ